MYAYHVVVVFMNKFSMVSYFPEAENLNGRNADMCFDVAGPFSSGSVIFLSFQIGNMKLLFYYFPHY